MENTQDAKAYQKGKNYLFFTGLFLDLTVLLAIFFTGLTFWIKDAALGISDHPLIVNAVYVLILSIGMYIIHFPLNLFLGFMWEHRFKLSNQKITDWLVDDLKKALIGLVLVLILVEGIYILLGRFEHSWWVWAGVFWLFLSFILAKLTPNVLIPLFYKYSSIDDQELRDRIFKLFESCKVSLSDVYSINLSQKSKKANAFLCGIGKNRRVVLSDTLLSNFSVEEIETVVAHELGHYKHRDIIKLLAVNAVMLFLGFFLVDKFLKYFLVRFGLERIDDIAFFPMLALVLIVFSFIITPFINGYSRMIETDADRFSLVQTKNPKDFVSMMKKLGEMNLAEFQPGRFVELFFYDHPPISKRIKFAENFSFSK